jgi:2-polyprenyl-3-methyl-5-hydroxy-6-metoxy-1,4-benzoquinol methylase
MFKLVSQNRFVAEVLLPFAVAGLFLGVFHAIGHPPRSPQGEVVFDLTAVIVAFLLLQWARTLGIRPMMREINRIAKAIQEPSREFLLKIAKERLAEIATMVNGLAQGQYAPEPPDTMAAWFRSFFQDGGPTYVGIDSHVPSEYLRAYQWYLSIHEKALGGARGRSDCRILVSDTNNLIDDFLREDRDDSAEPGGNLNAYVEFVNWHRRNGVRLLWIDTATMRRLTDDLGMDRADLGLWDNYAVLFEPAEGAGVKLSMRFPGERPNGHGPTYEAIKEFSEAVLAEAVELGDSPPDLELVDEALAGAWEQYVNLERRLDPDAPVGHFLTDVLSPLAESRSRVAVLDAAAGIGADSIFLLKQGFAVQSNEVDAHYRSQAMEHARRNGVPLDMRQNVWERLDQSMKGGWRFDAVLCVGNSLCLVRDRLRQREALRSFFNVLVGDGVLIIDERNFEYMLEMREQIEADPVRYFKPATEGDVMYEGLKLRGFPSRITDEEVDWRFFENQPPVKSSKDLASRRYGQKDLVLHPFRYGELHGLLRECGFVGIRVFADLQPTHHDPDQMPAYESVRDSTFLTYVAARPPTVISLPKSRDASEDGRDPQESGGYSVDRTA